MSKNKKRIKMMQGTSLLQVGSSEYTQFVALRQDLMANIQLADNKAFGIAQLNKNSDALKDWYLDVVSPNIETPEAPEGYHIFGAAELDHVKYQCDVLKDIVVYKYTIINEMIEYLRG